MEGLDFLGADPVTVRLPWWLRFSQPDAAVGALEEPQREASPRRAAMVRRAIDAAAGACVGAAYGAMIGSMPLCALAGAAICGVLMPQRDDTPIPLARIPMRPLRETPQPSVAMVKREPEDMPAAPTTNAEDRFGKLEID